jgi:2-oxoglutarate ferredoxin oxidoreductase subunit alpha
LWPFPYDAIREAAARVKGILCVELNAGQMIEDVRIAVSDRIPVKHFGRMGGIVPNPQEVLGALNKEFINPSESKA